MIIFALNYLQRNKCHVVKYHKHVYASSTHKSSPNIFYFVSATLWTHNHQLQTLAEMTMTCNIINTALSSIMLRILHNYFVIINHYTFPQKTRKPLFHLFVPLSSFFENIVVINLNSPPQFLLQHSRNAIIEIKRILREILRQSL